MKARKVEVKGVEFSNLWKEAFGATKTLYMHNLLDHLPQQIRDFSIDLWRLQLQALEHYNKKRKQSARGNCNGHKPGNQALVPVRGYKHHRTGTPVKAQMRWSGTCMAFQLLHLNLFQNHIDQMLAARSKQDEMKKVRHHGKVKKEAAKARGRRLAFDEELEL